jgi:hypothetical protein
MKMSLIPPALVVDFFLIVVIMKDGKVYKNRVPQ